MKADKFIEKDCPIRGTDSLHTQYGENIAEVKALCKKFKIRMSEAIQIQRTMSLSVALTEIAGLLKAIGNK